MATEKDLQIIRQSTLKMSLDWFQIAGKKPEFSDLIKISTMLQDYCVNGYSKSLVEKFEKLDEHIKQQYIG